MTDQTFRQLQAIELKRLLDEAQDDPILGPQLKERLVIAQSKVEQSKYETSKSNADLPRTAIFFRGGGVTGSTGIRPSLAGEALIQYEKMFVEEALLNEREAAKSAGKSRRPKGSPTPGLLFTGTPRGSFGLEFVPQAFDDPSLLESSTRALKSITTALVDVAEADDEKVNDIIGGIPATVLQPMRQFMKTLSDHGAELRVAFNDRPSRSLKPEQVRRASERLEREVTETETIINGKFRGMTLQSGYFDIVSDVGETISGKVGPLPESELLRIHALTNRQCSLIVRATTVRRVTGDESTSYVLMGAKAG